MFNFKSQPYKKVKFNAVAFKYLAYIGPLFAFAILYYGASQFIENRLAIAVAFAFAVWIFIIYTWVSKKSYAEIERRNADGIFE